MQFFLLSCSSTKMQGSVSFACAPCWICFVGRPTVLLCPVFSTLTPEPYCQVCTANANASQANGVNVASGPLPTGAIARPSASVFREFEVEVRPEPPPPPVAPDGRTAEDTLIGQMGLGGDGGAFRFKPGDRNRAIEVQHTWSIAPNIGCASNSFVASYARTRGENNQQESSPGA